MIHIIDIIDEESKIISHEVLALAKQAAVAMELDGKAVEERLLGFELIVKI